MARFGQWKFTADREATAKAYAAAPMGRSETCDCSGCRNFRMARSQMFPAGFLGLLDDLGIDPQKASEIVHYGRLEDGLHYYGGWYHFVGHLEETGDFAPVEFGPGFNAFMLRARAPRLSTFRGSEVVQLEFDCKVVPWLLDEPDMD